MTEHHWRAFHRRCSLLSAPTKQKSSWFSFPRPRLEWKISVRWVTLMNNKTARPIRIPCALNAVTAKDESSPVCVGVVGSWCLRRGLFMCGIREGRSSCMVCLFGVPVGSPICAAHLRKRISRKTLSSRKSCAIRPISARESRNMARSRENLALTSPFAQENLELGANPEKSLRWRPVMPMMRAVLAIRRGMQRQKEP